MIHLYGFSQITTLSASVEIHENYISHGYFFLKSETPRPITSLLHHTIMELSIGISSEMQNTSFGFTENNYLYLSPILKRAGEKSPNLVMYFFKNINIV